MFIPSGIFMAIVEIVMVEGVGIGDDSPDFLALPISGDVSDDAPQNQVVAVVRNR